MSAGDVCIVQALTPAAALAKRNAAVPVVDLTLPPRRRLKRKYPHIIDLIDDDQELPEDAPATLPRHGRAVPRSLFSGREDDGAKPSASAAESSSREIRVCRMCKVKATKCRTVAALHVAGKPNPSCIQCCYGNLAESKQKIKEVRDSKSVIDTSRQPQAKVSGSVRLQQINGQKHGQLLGIKSKIGLNVAENEDAGCYFNDMYVLDVEYEDKDKVKRLGAVCALPKCYSRNDKHGCWCVPAGRQLEQFYLFDPRTPIYKRRCYLDATYHERTTVKHLGAKYDSDYRKWWVLPSHPELREIFGKWMRI